MTFDRNNYKNKIRYSCCGGGNSEQKHLMWFFIWKRKTKIILLLYILCVCVFVLFFGANFIQRWISTVWEIFASYSTSVWLDISIVSCKFTKHKKKLRQNIHVCIKSIEFKLVLLLNFEWKYFFFKKRSKNDAYFPYFKIGDVSFS